MISWDKPSYNLIFFRHLCCIQGGEDGLCLGSAAPVCLRVCKVDIGAKNGLEGDSDGSVDGVHDEHQGEAGDGGDQGDPLVVILETRPPTRRLGVAGGEGLLTSDKSARKRALTNDILFCEKYQKLMYVKKF